MVSLLRIKLGHLEVKQAIFWRDVVSEFFNSFFLLFVLTMNQAHFFGDWWIRGPTHTGLTMALVVFILVESFSHLGGCHMSPAVTEIIFLEGNISVVKSAVYIIAQCCGAACGSAIVYALTPESHRDLFGPFQPADPLGPYRALGIEIILSTLLHFVILGVTDPKRGTMCNMPGLPVGCAVGVDIMVAMSYTGAAMNPIIAFGPAVITRNFKNHWIYWTGPLLGAALSYALYTGLSSVKEPCEINTEDIDNDEEWSEEKLEALEDLLRERRSKQKLREEKAHPI